jgi:hypothetical protein
MRYSIMLQLVGIITLILVGAACLFAWLQNRETLPSKLESQLLGNPYSFAQSRLGKRIC